MKLGILFNRVKFLLFGGSMQRTKKNHGFTLIELMVTIAVIAIIAMMAVPSMGNLMAKQRLNTTAKDLAYIFSQARSQSAVLRKEVTVKFAGGVNDATNFYWAPRYDDIKLTSDTTDVVFQPIGLVTSRQIMILNPAFKEAQPENPETNPRKIPKAVPLIFTLCSTKLNASKEINISKTGIIEKIEDKQGACS